MKRTSAVLAFCLLSITVAPAQKQAALREDGIDSGKGISVVKDDQPVGAGLNATGTLPRFVKYTGTARASQDSNAQITFSIYSQESGGTPIWSETQTAKVNGASQYTVLLGAANAQGLPSQIFSSGEARWLGISVNGGAEQNRVLLVSVPYAMKSGDSDSLGGKPASAYVLADSLANYMRANSTNQAQREELLSPVYPGNPTSPVSSTGGTSGYVPVFSTDNVIVDSRLFQNGNWLGINATTPNAGHVFNGFPHNDVSGVNLETDGRIFSRGLEVDDFGLAPPNKSSVHVHNHSTGGNAFEANAWGGAAAFGFYATTRSPNGAGAVGLAFNDPTQQQGVDTAYGMLSVNLNHYGAAVLGYSAYDPLDLAPDDPILDTSIGLMGLVLDPNGISGVFRNLGNGQLISAQNDSGEVFSVDGNGDVTTSGIISGNGSGLTNVSAANLSAGTYTGAYTFNNASNSFTGNGSGLTSVNASQLNGSSDTAFAKLASANSFTNSNSFSGTTTLTGAVDATTSSHTLPIRAFTGALPTGGGTCTANKELIIRTDGSSGNQLYLCNPTGDGWISVNTDPPADTSYTDFKFLATRLLASAFSPGSLATRTLSIFTPQNGITIRRISAAFQTASSGCTTEPTIDVSNGTASISASLTSGVATLDTSVTSTNMAGGTQITISTTAGTGGGCVQPTDGNILIQYRMQ